MNLPLTKRKWDANVVKGIHMTDAHADIRISMQWLSGCSYISDAIASAS